MRAVALGAGVAEKTVCLQYATKTALWREVETAIVGDDDVPVAARGWFTDALGEPDPQAKLRIIVDGTTALHERTGPMFSVARGAAAGRRAAVGRRQEGPPRGHETTCYRPRRSPDDPARA